MTNSETESYKDEDLVGRILSGASTNEAPFQLLELAEQGKVFEGKLILIIRSFDKQKLLGRVNEIQPYQEFYQKGGIFSAAIRKAQKVPSEIANRYISGKMQLLMELPRNEINFPPQPGDPIYLIDPKKNVKDIFGIDEKEPGIAWFGSLIGYSGLKVPFNVNNLTMHIAILGTTGSGKSFDTGALYESLTKIKVDETRMISVPTMIIDANGDYLEYYEYFCKKKQINSCSWLKRYVFPNIYKYIPNDEKNENLGQIKIDLNILNSRDLAETIILYKLGHLEEADLQISLLTRFFTNLESRSPRPDINQLFTEESIIRELNDFLNEENEKQSWAAATVKAAISALGTFKEVESNYNLLSNKQASDLTSKNMIAEITKNGGTAIIDFSIKGAANVMPKVKQLVVAYLATFLYEIFSRYAVESLGDLRYARRYLFFIIEEAQNFIPDISYPIPNSLAKSKLALIATQGRKFGLCLGLVTQRPSFVDRIVLSMCNSFFIHRLSPEDISYTQKASGGLPPEMVSKLTRLPKGEAFFLGQTNFVNFPLHIKITHEDRKIPHEMGSTNLVKDLKQLRYPGV